MAKIRTKWYNERTWATVLGIVSLILTYLMASHALDTGSWQQYFLTGALLGFGLNRLIKAVRPDKAANKGSAKP